MARKIPEPLHAAAETLGHEGGKKGGPARARKLTQARIREIAASGGRAAARKRKA